MILATPAQRFGLLRRSRTVALVGASANHARASYFVFSYLRTKGRFEVAPINPSVAEIDGVASYPTLAAYAAERGAPDLVDVFRRPSEAPAVARDAVAVGARAIWFQYGVVNEDAIAIADRAGLDVVVDRCLKVESARFDGGLSSGGFDSGIVWSQRIPLLSGRPERG